jgi:hypothetical protein
MGVGLPCFSDKAQVMKWEALMRCLAVGGDPAASMNGFLNRLPESTSSATDHLRTLKPPIRWQNKKRYTARSLTEWFSEAELSMTGRLPKQGEEYAPNDPISGLAEQLRLWPYDLYSEEDNADLPPIRLVATDGSFRIQPRGAGEADLGWTGSGAGAVLFLAPGYNDARALLQSQKECESSSHSGLEPGMNAFTWELIAQEIALHFTKYLPDRSSSIILPSDCTSAISLVNKSLSTRYNRLTNARRGISAIGASSIGAHQIPPRTFHSHQRPSRTKQASPRELDLARQSDMYGGCYRSQVKRRQYWVVVLSPCIDTL